MANELLIDTFAMWNNGQITAAVITLGPSGLTSSKVNDISFTVPTMGQGSACKLASMSSGDGLGKHLTLNGVNFKFSSEFAPTSEFIEIQLYAGDVNSGNTLVDEFRFIYKRVDVGDNTIMWINNLEAKTWMVQHAGRIITVVMTPATGSYISIVQKSLDGSVQWNYNGTSPLSCANPTFPLKIGDSTLKMNAIDENTLSQLFKYTYTGSHEYTETPV